MCRGLLRAGLHPGQRDPVPLPRFSPLPALQRCGGLCHRPLHSPAGGLRIPRFLQAVGVARADGSYVRELARLAKMDVLILDDWASFR